MASTPCICKDPIFDEVRSLWGEVLCVQCRKCGRPLQIVCRVCKEPFKSLAMHLARSECGRFDREGLWWSTERPPTARQVFP